MRSEIDANIRSTEDLDQLIPDNLYDLLSGTQGLQHFLSKSLRPDSVRELLHDLEIDVRFQQGDPYFLQGLFDVQLAKLPFSLSVNPLDPPRLPRLGIHVHQYPIQLRIL